LKARDLLVVFAYHFFASRHEQLLRGIGQKIPLHHKLANFGVQIIDFSRVHLFWG